jgi:hypothetical protein
MILIQKFVINIGKNDIFHISTAIITKTTKIIIIIYIFGVNG